MPGGHDRQRHLIGEAAERVGVGRVGAREEGERAEDFVVGDERERQHGAQAVRERAVAPGREAGIAVDTAGPQRAAANGRPGRADAVRRLVPAHDDVVEERRGRTGGGADLHLPGGAFQADLHKGVAVRCGQLLGDELQHRVARLAAEDHSIDLVNQLVMDHEGILPRTPNNET